MSSKKHAQSLKGQEAAQHVVCVLQSKKVSTSQPVCQWQPLSTDPTILTTSPPSPSRSETSTRLRVQSEPNDSGGEDLNHRDVHHCANANSNEEIAQTRKRLVIKTKNPWWPWLQPSSFIPGDEIGENRDAQKLREDDSTHFLPSEDGSNSLSEIHSNYLANPRSSGSPNFHSSTRDRNAIVCFYPPCHPLTYILYTDRLRFRSCEQSAAQPTFGCDVKNIVSENETFPNFQTKYANHRDRLRQTIQHRRALLILLNFAGELLQ